MVAFLAQHKSNNLQPSNHAPCSLPIQSQPPYRGPMSNFLNRSFPTIWSTPTLGSLRDRVRIPLTCCSWTVSQVEAAKRIIAIPPSALEPIFWLIKTAVYAWPGSAVFVNCRQVLERRFVTRGEEVSWYGLEAWGDGEREPGEMGETFSLSKTDMLASFDRTQYFHCNTT